MGIHTNRSKGGGGETSGVTALVFDGSTVEGEIPVVSDGTLTPYLSGDNSLGLRTSAATNARLAPVGMAWESDAAYERLSFAAPAAAPKSFDFFAQDATGGGTGGGFRWSVGDGTLKGAFLWGYTSAGTFNEIARMEMVSATSRLTVGYAVISGLGVASDGTRVALSLPSTAGAGQGIALKPQRSTADQSGHLDISLPAGPSNEENGRLRVRCVRSSGDEFTVSELWIVEVSAETEDPELFLTVPVPQYTLLTVTTRSHAFNDTSTAGGFRSRGGTFFRGSMATAPLNADPALLPSSDDFLAAGTGEHVAANINADTTSVDLYAVPVEEPLHFLIEVELFWTTRAP